MGGLPALPIATQWPHRRGYTLIELLIVLGIIAALAGILLTGVFAVRRKVDAVHCTANLLQLGAATRMYIADYHTLPLVWYGWGMPRTPRRPPSPPLSHNIALVLRSYVSAPEVLQCPTTRRYWTWIPYVFNLSGSGLRPSQVKPPPSRAMIMKCVFDVGAWGPKHGWLNAIFLDGHVKAYEWIPHKPLYEEDTDPPYWPPD